MEEVSPLLRFDRENLKGFSGIVGVDEAGRGALAGPVVAAAVWLDTEFYNSSVFETEVAGINDSKQLSEQQRSFLFEKIYKWVYSGWVRIEWAEASVEEIEQLNILGATKLAMERALDALNLNAFSGQELPTVFQDMPLFFEKTTTSQFCMHPRVLIDGKPLKNLKYLHEGLVSGDAKSLAIAMASIVAKVNRDRILSSLEKEYSYGFSKHKGYGTKAHRDAIQKKGASPLHRKSFLSKTILPPQQTQLSLSL